MNLTVVRRFSAPHLALSIASAGYGSPAFTEARSVLRAQSGQVQAGQKALLQMYETIDLYAPRLPSLRKLRPTNPSTTR
jgi:hypothetical protein